MATAQTADFCDPGLPRPAGPLAYQNRPSGDPDRCEGRFIQEISAVGWLRVASLLDGPPSVPPEADRVSIQWSRPAGDPVRVRAQGFGRQYYRMDTEVDGDGFGWSTASLAAADLSLDELGIVAWSTATLGGVERPLYLPARLGASTADRLLLDLEPTLELFEVYVSVARTDSRGAAREYVLDGKDELGFGYYPAGKRLRIPLPRPAIDGTYLVEIAALLANGQAESHELWFFHED